MAEELPPQGSVEVGIAGPDMARESYDYSRLGELVAQLKKDRPVPAWYDTTARKFLEELIKPKVSYRFSDYKAGYYWTLTRVITRYLWAMSKAMYEQPENDALRKQSWQKAWSTRYTLIENLRRQFQAAADGDFTFLEQNYRLEKPFPDIGNHIYVHRGNQAIVYHGITIPTARGILEAIEKPGKAKLNRADIDDFVCAFFAESTRWPEEQMYNLFATFGKRSEVVLTGDNGILPLASGSTWEARLNALGRDVPRRTVDYTKGIGLNYVIDQELGKSADTTAFASKVIKSMMQ
jgi:hypothetical protein